MNPRQRVLGVGLALLAGVVLGFGSTASATVAMQKKAKELGFPVQNCHYCHASKKAVRMMKQLARQAGYTESNCVHCHRDKLPATLNERGEWLVAQKKERGAREIDVSWLKDYVEKTEEAHPEKTPSDEKSH